MNTRARQKTSCESYRVTAIPPPSNFKDGHYRKVKGCCLVKNLNLCIMKFRKRFAHIELKLLIGQIEI